MKRDDLIKKMVACWDTSKGMGYNNLIAMDRVLEIAEENGMLPPKRLLTNEEIEAYETIQERPKSYCHKWSLDNVKK